MPLEGLAPQIYRGGLEAYGSFGRAIEEASRTYALKKQKEREMAMDLQKALLLKATPEAEPESQRTKRELENVKTQKEIEKLNKELSGEITDKEELTRATTLRKEFNADTVYKNYEILQQSVDGLKDAYNLATNPDIKSKLAADQALGVLFQKMLDPQSVVRESEYARTPEGAALLNRMGSFVEQLQKGGLRIADEDRLALIQMSNRLLKSSQRRMNAHMSRYESIAKDYNVRPKLLFGDMKSFDIPKTFMLNGEPYEIPESEVEAFLTDNPEAEEIQ